MLHVDDVKVIRIAHVVETAGRIEPRLEEIRQRSILRVIETRPSDAPEDVRRRIGEDEPRRSNIAVG